MRHASNFNKQAASAAVVILVLLTFALPARAQLSLQQALMLHAHGAFMTAPGVSLTAPGASFDAPDAAQTRSSLTTEDALHALADEASLIFTGQVVALHQAGGAMAIDLRVDNAVRGVSAGQLYTMREWAGLWTGNADRLHMGQRALFLLHAPSVGGFSSPVGGADGIIPLSGDRNNAAVDLRWIAARVTRRVVLRPDNAPDGTVAAEDAVYPATVGTVTATPEHRASAAANGIAWPADATNGNVLGPDLRRIDQSLVTGLLRAWTSTATASVESR